MPASPSPLLVVAGLFVLGLLGASLGAWIYTIIQIAAGRPPLPRSRPRQVPWGLWSVAGVIVLYFAVQLLTVMAFGLVRHRAKGQHLAAREVMTLVSASNAVLLLLVPAFLRGSSGAGVDDLGLTSSRPLRDIGRGFVGWVMLTPVINLIMYEVVKLLGQRGHHPVEEMLRNGMNGPVMLLTFASAVVLAPAAEELLFRGVLLGWLAKLWTRPKAPKFEEEADLFLDELPVIDALAVEEHRHRFAESPWEPPSAPIATTESPQDLDDGPTGQAFWMPNIVASIVFAGLHFPQWPAPIPLFFLSLGLGYLYLRTGNLLAPFVVHALFNGTSTAALFVSLWQRAHGA